ncbi:DNA oxidative demethylase AlkB [Aquabacterium sp.]|uniref:DNA oxidative demethylase AlkB n=1 Tax=Aquabacterium sp. TaxID=1872578 RepID=UPI0039C88262
MRAERCAATPDLFAAAADAQDTVPLEPGAVVLPGLALPQAEQLLHDVAGVLAQAPLRHLVTPGGYTMSVAMSNCGPLGWTSDITGYRYTATDPLSGRPWPALPAAMATLARQAAARAGFDGFTPDACLINQYSAGARLSLHQDRDEHDLRQPIVSVSLGLPAVFLWGGARRSAPVRRIPLSHGDVVVWGGPARLHYHGVLALKGGCHPLTGEHRINLTFRCAS